MNVSIDDITSYFSPKPAPLTPRERLLKFFQDSNNQMIIIILLVLIILISLLGVIFEPIKQFFVLLYQYFFQIISFFGWIIGTIINKIANLYGDTGRFTIDITEGTLHDVGNLVKDITKEKMTNLTFGIYDESNNYPLTMVPPKEPSPDFTLNPTQSHLSSNQSKWCSVGTIFGQPSCVELGEYDRCISEKVFPTQKMCLNPTFTNNM
jgi:hypothetical protein